MRIENGLLKGTRWKAANASGGLMTPRLICLHDTAGQCTKYSSVNWFASKECKVSAHFVVERDGTITQMVRTDRRAYHAGVSHWKGVSGLNSCSVGIEIVNPGKLDDKGCAWFGQAVEKDQIQKKSTPNHGAGYWLPYTEAQIKAVTALCRALVEEYPDCNEIVTHWEIAPKRKIDVNPLFPLEELRRAVFEPTPGEVEHLALEEAPLPGPATKPPSVVTTAVKSKTNASIIASVGIWVTKTWTNGVEWLGEFVGGGAEVMQLVNQDVNGWLDPIVALMRTLQVNMSGVLGTIAIALAIVAIARHTRDRGERDKLKAMVPEAEAKGA